LSEDARGFPRFVVIWSGQVVSLFGSGLTAFALGVWVFQQTGSVTLYTWAALAATLQRSQPCGRFDTSTGVLE
jgi:hypothetical protein